MVNGQWFDASFLGLYFLAGGVRSIACNLQLRAGSYFEPSKRIKRIKRNISSSYLEEIEYYTRSFRRSPPDCFYLQQVTAVWSYGDTPRPWDVFPSWAVLHWEAYIWTNSYSSKIWPSARSSGQKRLGSDSCRYVLDISTVIYRNANCNIFTFPILSFGWD